MVLTKLVMLLLYDYSLTENELNLLNISEDDIVVISRDETADPASLNPDCVTCYTERTLSFALADCDYESEVSCWCFNDPLNSTYSTCLIFIGKSSDSKEFNH